MMILLISFQNAFMQKFSFPNGVNLTQISSANDIIDVVVCDNVVYQKLLNGSVQAKGFKPFLVGNESQFFVEIKLNNVYQLYCFKDQLWFVTTYGQVFQEVTDYLNNVTYFIPYSSAGIPTSGVKQIVGDDMLQFVLTDDKILVRGASSVNKIFCGTPVNIATTFLKLPLTLNVSDIQKLSVSRNREYLFVYMNNGDLFTLGDNSNGILGLADQICERKIGINITKADIGWNHTRAQMSLYFIQSGNLYIQDTNMVTSSLILNFTGDFIMYDFIMSGEYTVFNIQCVQNSVLTDISHSGKLMRTGIDYYCLKNASDQRCIQFTTDDDNHCYGVNASEPFCQVYNCFLYNNCSSTTCSDQNITCRAIQCLNAARKGVLVPECSNFTEERTYSTKFQNALDYKFVNGLLMQFRISKPEAVKRNNIWIIVSCCVAAVVVVIIASVAFICKRKITTKKLKKPVKHITKQKLNKTLMEQYIYNGNQLLK
ncbi:Regulator_of chromosome condensation 1/beta-lactamase-inhibitor protein II [Hexamita inflata]|uniref:Regulator of chromosome condensation 1/beta-lactamase-inhibitor protein II n=1 Tax=Hexamita inflata TaxID=28002 RepID=A0AA86PS41_9EUKA|nr:Regulator of chromosome condensation 1/beta-lactamase-inhibitor protein II [Hexamita inflata]